MEYRQLGDCGLKVSVVSLGGWLTFGEHISQDATEAILREAFDGGINFIDLADVYARGEAERCTGRAIAGKPRHELVLSSKVFWPMSDDPNDRGLSRKHIVESAERSLRNLGTDYLDLYFCHREDPDVRIEETVRAMEDLIRQGKILHWGTSLWKPRSLKRAHRVARQWRAYGPVVEQPRYNLLHRGLESWMIPTVRKLRMGLVVWSPLAGGVLTGKYNDGIPEGSRGATTDWVREDLVERSMDRVRRFCAVAEDQGVSPAVLALAWLMKQPGVSSVITGATSPAQVRENLEALRVVVSSELDRRIKGIFPRE